MSKLPFVRSPYNYDMYEASDASGLRCEDVSLAVQSARDECDINLIVDKFTRTGELPPAVGEPKYGDFTGYTDYHSSLNLVRDASTAFANLPAALRARFNNDPNMLVDFVSDSSNYAEAASLGLVPPLPEASPRPTDSAVGDAPKGNSKPSKKASNADFGGTSGGDDLQ